MLGERGRRRRTASRSTRISSRYLEEKGIEVVAEDAVSHLAELEPGAVDGIVGLHLVEHLPAAAVSSLVALAAEKLAEGGILILETPNPESLVAGSINFHRDLTHVRPIHPDTLAFLCESAGFSEVEIRTAVAGAEDELLLRRPATRRSTRSSTQLNELLYGFQDYAVVATASSYTCRDAKLYETSRDERHALEQLLDRVLDAQHPLRLRHVVRLELPEARVRECRAHELVEALRGKCSWPSIFVMWT